ncbi:citramalate synthase [Candidatus Curtissbacteria bacterium RBG_13_35_7]|uniref:Citramalate synthase n=1 Tax=Candidatus Curtissbacteria bacterium RBG_13_35_7 TaxID=1797705 RepID=A0A1F5G356_9BACT|nr:MAG: citramalate synthase [Candidatus Curtissbacteria bacterium RBG_13_35_7]
MSQERLTIVPYETTLRDGNQSVGVDFSTQSKLEIAKKLDKFGFTFIEGGFPQANPTDTEFFTEIKNVDLKNAKIVVFGATARVDMAVENDPLIDALLKAETEFVTIFGKSWTRHVEEALQTTLKRNLRTIYDSVSFLKSNGRRVIYDAEHFYDGFKADWQYALDTLMAARDGGAEVIVLCDTNGGCLPKFVYQATQEAAHFLGAGQLMGIHTHNDSGLALANTLEAIGAISDTQRSRKPIHVQGAFNRMGERAGNVNLAEFLPVALFKLGWDIGFEDLQGIRNLAEFIGIYGGHKVAGNDPFVGEVVFRHKGGVHISGSQKIKDAYLHIDPKLVGNSTDYEHSDQGGRANILAMAKKHGFELEKDDLRLADLAQEMKKLKIFGDAQEFLFLYRHLKKEKELPFEVDNKMTNVLVPRFGDPKAQVAVRVNGQVFIKEATGVGPFHAFDLALRKAVGLKYPQVLQVKLKEYAVDSVFGSSDTAAQVDVKITFQTDGKVWSSRVRSSNEEIANQNALIDGFLYQLAR